MSVRDSGSSAIDPVITYVFIHLQVVHLKCMSADTRVGLQWNRLHSRVENANLITERV